MRVKLREYGGNMFEYAGWGKKRRLSQIVAPDGRAVMLAIDHGYFMGATHGMEKPAQAISNLLPHVDSLMLTAGVLRTDVQPDFGKGIVLRASGGNTVLDKDIDNEEIILKRMLYLIRGNFLQKILNYRLINFG